MHAKVVLRRDGTLRADDIRAGGLTGTIKGNAEASFDGLRLRRATVSVKIPKDDPFPVTIDGQSIARASGATVLIHPLEMAGAAFASATPPRQWLLDRGLPHSTPATPRHEADPPPQPVSDMPEALLDYLRP